MNTPNGLRYQKGPEGFHKMVPRGKYYFVNEWWRSENVPFTRDGPMVNASSNATFFVIKDYF